MNQDEQIMSARTKLILYMVALLVLQIQTGTADYTADDVATWQPWDWFKLVIAILGSLALSARMFFDQSVSREKIEASLKQSLVVPGGSTPTIQPQPTADPKVSP